MACFNYKQFYSNTLFSATPYLFVLFSCLDDLCEASASEELRRNVTKPCAENGSGPVGCHNSSFDQRLKSGLTIGAVCLLLMLGAGSVFVYYARKWSKSNETDSREKPRQKEEKGNPQTQPSSDVFTITKDKANTVNEFSLQSYDTDHLVNSEWTTAQRSREHLEKTFDSYSKPAD